MRNTYIIRYNRNSLIHFTGLDMVDGSAISNCTAHSILFDDLVSTIQRCAKKSRCIDSVMYYASGYSYDEISEILNKNELIIESMTLLRKQTNYQLKKQNQLIIMLVLLLH
jgi:hypothetical protein